MWDKTRRKDGTFSVDDFQWDGEADQYVCPAGKTLRRNHRHFKVPRVGITKDNTIIYRAREADCQHCSFKQRCCPNTTHRKITRSIHEDARDIARAIYQSDEYMNKSVNERKKVEMLFAHMKRHLRFDRLRLRGIKSANDECLLVATVQNLKKITKLCAQPPPAQGIVMPAAP